MFTKRRVAPVAAEFLGTALWVIVVLVMTETTAVSYFVATSLALTVGMVVMFFGSVSGTHINPAITFGMWTARKISTLRAASYVVAQFLGALAAWQLFQYLTGRDLPAKTASYTTPMLIAELVGTAVFAMGVTAALVRGLDALQSALTYAASLFTGVLIASVAAAGFINPAAALGLRSWSSVYVLGPLLGGLIGVNLYLMLFGPDRATASSRAARSTRARSTRKKRK